MSFTLALIRLCRIEQLLKIALKIISINGSLRSSPSYNNFSFSVESGCENVSLIQELPDQRRTINYRQDQMDQVIALNNSTERYEPV